MAGGSGTRLNPITSSVSKHLLPIYDKPMIYYPLSTLMLAGCREIALIIRPQDQEQYFKLLGTGSELGISIEYFHQEEPRGIAEAFVICEHFIDGEGVALILGDNLFHGQGMGTSLQQYDFNSGATVFAYQVNQPQNYGVVSFDAAGVAIDLEEKPLFPKSNFAVTGLYFYDQSVVARTKNLRPSKRGELEITELNKSYLVDKQLNVVQLPRGTAWLDTGTPSDLLAAGNYVKLIEERQGMKISVPEEVALNLGLITEAQLQTIASRLTNSEYKSYLLSLI